MRLTAIRAASTSASTSATAPNSTASTATTSGGPQSTSTTTSTSPAKNEAIPPVAGDTVSIAELYLEQVGLRSGRKLQRSDTNLQSGLVITTSPYQGDVVPFGSAIDLVVSTGSPGCQPGSSGLICNLLGTVVTMPYILRQTLQQAMTTLALQNITLGSHVFQASSATEGTIICTVPAAGDSFYLTMPVQVAISSGNPASPTATLCATSSTPPPTSPPPTSPTSPPTSPRRRRRPHPRHRRPHPRHRQRHPRRRYSRQPPRNLRRQDRCRAGLGYVRLARPCRSTQ